MKAHTNPLPPNPNTDLHFDPEALREIYLAGGCFWGVQAYFARIYGVAATRAGYANGDTPQASYQALAHTGHAETVQVRYDPARVNLATVLAHFFAIIDPTSVDRQGGDVGRQYRTAIYYTDQADLPALQQAMAAEQRKHSAPLATQVEPLAHFIPAEAYHQDYLENTPGGYCHVRFDTLRTITPRVDAAAYAPTTADTLAGLTDMQRAVTQHDATEPPFANEYNDEYRRGIYVDITTGEPLFVSSAKFDAGCGWPSFARPIDQAVIVEREDLSHGRRRTEVRSRVGDAHLGHVFNDGPQELGGLRYCINGAALRFIPVEDMQTQGYGMYIPYV